MGPQKFKIVPFIFFVLLGGIFAFSLYVFFTTENTLIVINEPAVEPDEVFMEGNTLPAPEVLPEEEPNPRIRILETGVGFLNVRNGASLQARQIGRVSPGEVYEYTEIENGWYHIVHPELKDGWVFGQYIQAVE